MCNIILGYFFAIAYFICIVALGLIITKIKIIKNKRFLARKIIHIFICFEWFIMYYFFNTDIIHWMILSFSILILLLVFVYGRFFKNITFYHDEMIGVILYPLVTCVFLCLSYFNFEYIYLLGITMVSLSLGDGFAGILGYYIKNINIYKNKTLVGYLVNLFFVILTFLIFKRGFDINFSIQEILVISFISVMVEVVSSKGLDNLFIPLVIFLLSFISLKTDLLVDYFFSLISISIIILLILNKKLLTKGGIISGAIISFFVISGFKDQGFILLCIFFVFVSICDLIKKNKKKKILLDIHDNLGKRNYKQVLACGIFPSICALLFLISGNDLCIYMYITVLAETLADTASSEIGVLSKSKPIDICTFKKIDSGISGGISILGSFAGVSSIIVFTLLSLIITTSFTITNLLIISFASLIGIIFDSLIGSLIQKKNKCEICGIITEKEIHCGEITLHYRGFKWLNNSLVNFICNFISMGLVYILFVLI